MKQHPGILLVITTALLPLGGLQPPCAGAQPPFQPPVSYEKADARAGALLARMTLEEKLQLIQGHNKFFVHGFPRLGIPELYLSDATQGVHLRKQLDNQLEKSVAFPCPIALAATWNPRLAYRYARSIGEECRVGNVAVLLGPGMNLYRISQCGRNFEYFGEDPFLAARLVESYVRGVLDTGTIPTLKHFVTNNTEFRRRTANAIVDERTLHEIYLPAFKAGIEAGAMGVMTSYSLLNGEWCGQSRYVITDLLRGSLGYRWMVMTDWVAVWDTEKLLTSGQDLEMPGPLAGERSTTQEALQLLASGRVERADIDRMARSILRTCIAMGLHDRPVRDESYLANFPEHVRVALETAREGIVLLKNDGVLPLTKNAAGSILVTGLYVDQLAHGGGSANVEGFDIVSLRQALADQFGDRVKFVAEPTDDELKQADTVLLSTGTYDSEGWDRPFALSPEAEYRVQHAVELNPRTVIVVNSGGGIRMTAWHGGAAAIVYGWYPGQIGNRALAEVLSGEVNPSGKLPITIERRFEDSPGYGYLPVDDQLYAGFSHHLVQLRHPIYPIEYKEGVFVGYRWYDAKAIAPLYAFGHGLSYTTFEYGQPRVAAAGEERISVTCAVRNTGRVAGAEVMQVYVHPPGGPIARPEKELKGFAKISLAPGESREVTVTLSRVDFARWDVTIHGWMVVPGDYELWIGGASDRIAARATVSMR